MTFVDPLKRHWFALTLAVGLGLAVYQNVTLGRINQALKSRVLEALSEPVQTGDFIGSVRGVRLDGTYAQVDPSPTGTLILTMSPNCAACQRGRASAIKMADFVRAQGLAVIWVSRDGPAETIKYFDSSTGAGGSQAVLTEPPHAVYQSLRLGMVPQAVLVDAKGTVRHAVVGELRPDTERKLQEAIAAQASEHRAGSK